MSKTDGDRDESPIRFEIPHMGRRGRAPIPINQPNWKYGTSVPSRAEWALMISLDLIFVSLVYVISTRSSWDYRFSGLILMGILCTLITANTLGTYLRAITAKNSHRKEDAGQSLKRDIPNTEKITISSKEKQNG